MENTNTRSKVYEQYYEYPIPFDPEGPGLDVFKDVEKAPNIEDFDEEFKKANCYMNNTLLMAHGAKPEYTQEQLDELTKCSNDVIYFIVNYCKIITLSNGLQLFKLYQYQKNAIKVMHENRFSIFKFPRQMGKCLTKDAKIHIRINGTVIETTLGDLYNMVETENTVESYTPNYDYEILTNEGFKDFDGITSKFSEEIVEIKTSNGSTIKVTPKHEIKTSSGSFYAARDLSVGMNLGINEENLITSINLHKGKFRVGDIVAVKDTKSFVVNDMSAILSNCVDGESMVTLLDNKTGKIFDIHVAELYDYLREGNKDE